MFVDDNFYDATNALRITTLIYVKDNAYFDFNLKKFFSLDRLEGMPGDIDEEGLELYKILTKEEAYFYIVKTYGYVFEEYCFYNGVNTIEKHLEEFFKIELKLHGVESIKDLYDETCPCECEHLIRETDESILFFKCKKHFRNLNCSIIENDFHPNKCVDCKIKINEKAKKFYEFLKEYNMLDFRDNNIRFMIQHFCDLTMIDYDKYIEEFF